MGNADPPRLFERAEQHAERLAIRAREGDFSYNAILAASARVASALIRADASVVPREPDLDQLPEWIRTGAGPVRQAVHDLSEARIAFLVPPGFAYVATLWGIWRAGGVAVPLAVSHPPPELAYVIDDAGASTLIAHPDLAHRVGALAGERGIPLLSTDPIQTGTADVTLPVVARDRRALILYTSGTTSRPKGVVLTHANLESQITTLVEAWAWVPEDRVLCVLPLHHVHGLVNIVLCALWTGARCTILPRFDAEETWNAIASGGLTLFMAVPTIYARLIAAWHASQRTRRKLLSEASRQLRLTVSGSAPLSVRLLEEWRTIAGHTLLERYGMTEIGMALSNPLAGERRPGFVGTPLPGVELRLVGEDGLPVEPGSPGEIEVQGPSVFLEYWARPEATAAAFRDGWFRTGDVAVLEDGAYRILGRSSIDIIKTGGYKVSALEIEEVLRTHAAVQDCAVVGLEDAEWGERVCAAVVLDGSVDADTLRAWARERLAPYKVPSRIQIVPELPRNAMGKVNKAEVARALRLFG